MDDQRPDGPPPRIGIDRPESFSYSVFHERHPALIANLIRDFPYPPRLRDRLEALLAESLDGTVPPEVPPGPNAPFWESQIAERAGRPWRALPFIWAESYFYRRLLEAVEYFEPDSAWHGVDLFAPQKHAQLDGPEILADLDAYAALTERDPYERRQALLHASLWGNQADLGFRTTNAIEGRGAVVVDDSAALWDLVDGPVDRPVILVADNAGRELTADLALADSLLETGAGAVELHLKPHPYFVSDATGHDVLATLDAIGANPNDAVRALAERLRTAIRTGRLRLRAHPCYVLPSTYHHLPPDLARDFADAKLVILKGDLNYRRLVGDREWDAATAFGEVADYFPGAVAALRTAKSDLAVGIAPARLAELDSGRPDWRISGTHAMIQVHV
ncbi:protein-glutamate O-methyltransferase family protein [Glycomyces sp. TRM65418]|uniref:damage-control phosphatase ARMT1 family protein n=1 Tax=Glycomyces sp. TRM65418 TaxID=2867006 RepID=UPI001CE582FE|nr:damage-control phosphatase ARMT1 family protein [Glycomyces sp. TRM65418]MCC3763448.1 protein-glutamate O-methyltransferase family protein [Glycomyces sp. TRM65418]QZD57437.1 protein-glutamate O-methyltransferase family protein [Glycomyces sp. TRM65418]